LKIEKAAAGNGNEGMDCLPTGSMADDEGIDCLPTGSMADDKSAVDAVLLTPAAAVCGLR
jgi:hypothetical protein